jgi:amino-acid N-acetyltransferase
VTNRPVIATPARPGDAEGIAALLEANRDVETLLLLSPARIQARLADFVVVRGDASASELLGCAQLHRHGPHNVEIMSVAVQPEQQGRGIGRACVHACVERAAKDPKALIWLATTSPDYFARLGFVRIPMTGVGSTVLLAKLGVLVRQPIRRWAGVVLGGQRFMRWPARREPQS